MYRLLRTFAIILVLLGAVRSEKNCSSVSVPSFRDNIFSPPTQCTTHDSYVTMCMDYYTACIQRAHECSMLSNCFKGRMACLISITPKSTNCNEWATALTNAGMYITAGGAYEGSLLQEACEYGICRGIQVAIERTVHKNYFRSCTAKISSVCSTPPSFESPTYSPNETFYTATFNGTSWPTIIESAEDKHQHIKAALMKGFGQALGIPYWFLLTITSITPTPTSLIVKFIQRDDPASVLERKPVDALMFAFKDLVNNSARSRLMFYEFGEVTNTTPLITNATVDGFNTPALLVSWDEWTLKECEDSSCTVNCVDVRESLGWRQSSDTCAYQRQNSYFSYEMYCFDDGRYNFKRYYSPTSRCSGSAYTKILHPQCEQQSNGKYRVVRCGPPPPDGAVTVSWNEWTVKECSDSKCSKHCVDVREQQGYHQQSSTCHRQDSYPDNSYEVECTSNAPFLRFRRFPNSKGCDGYDTSVVFPSTQCIQTSPSTYRIAACVPPPSPVTKKVAAWEEWAIKECDDSECSHNCYDIRPDLGYTEISGTCVKHIRDAYHFTCVGDNHYQFTHFHNSDCSGENNTDSLYSSRCVHHENGKYRVTACSKPPPLPPSPTPATPPASWKHTVCYDASCSHNCMDGLKFNNLSAVSDTCFITGAQNSSMDVVCSNGYYKVRSYYTNDCSGNHRRSSDQWKKAGVCEDVGSGRYSTITCTEPPSVPTPRSGWNYLLCDDPLCSMNCVGAVEYRNLTAGDVCVSHRNTSESFELVCAAGSYTTRYYTTANCTQAANRTDPPQRAGVCRPDGTVPGKYSLVECVPIPVDGWSYFVCDDANCSLNCIDGVDFSGSNHTWMTEMRTCIGDVCATVNNTYGIQSHLKAASSCDEQHANLVPGVCTSSAGSNKFRIIACSAPSSASPNTPQYTITFGGSEWSQTLKGAPRGSAAYMEIEAAVVKGLSKVLSVPASLIKVVSLAAGSLVVNFVIRDDPIRQVPAVSHDAAMRKLQALRSDDGFAESTFAELQQLTGVTTVVSSVVGKVPSNKDATPINQWSLEVCDDPQCTVNCVDQVIQSNMTKSGATCRMTGSAASMDVVCLGNGDQFYSRVYATPDCTGSYSGGVDAPRAAGTCVVDVETGKYTLLMCRDNSSEHSGASMVVVHPWLLLMAATAMVVVL